MTRSPNKLIPADFDTVPSRRSPARVRVVESLDGVEAVGVAVHTDGDVPVELGLSRAALTAAGFDAKVGTVLVLPADEGPTRVAVGAGPRSEQSTATLPARARRRWRPSRATSCRR